MCINANLLDRKNITPTTRNLADHSNTIFESVFDVVEFSSCIVPCVSGGIDPVCSMMEKPPGSPKGMSKSFEKTRCYIQSSVCHCFQSLANFVSAIADWVGDATTTAGAATPDPPSSSMATTAWYDTLCNGSV